MTLSDYISAPEDVRMMYYPYLELIYLFEQHRRVAKAWADVNAGQS